MPFTFIGFLTRIFALILKGRSTGGVSNRGASRSGPVLPFVLFWGVPDVWGLFPIGPFPLSRPIN